MVNIITWNLSPFKYPVKNNNSNQTAMGNLLKLLNKYITIIIGFNAYQSTNIVAFV